MLSLLAARRDISAAAVAPLSVGAPNALKETEGVLASWFERHGVIAALVRPDHYVFGTARNATELGDLMDEIDVRLHDGPAGRNNETSDLRMEKTP